MTVAMSFTHAIKRTCFCVIHIYSVHSVNPREMGSMAKPIPCELSRLLYMFPDMQNAWRYNGNCTLYKKYTTATHAFSNLHSILHLLLAMSKPTFFADPC